MFRDWIKRIGGTAFWLTKWLLAAAGLIGILLVGIVALLRSDIDFDTFLNYFALGLLIFVLITLFYGIIAIHDVPYEIAKSRNHPHQDAIHAAGWVSLFTLHAIWPFLWIWAMLYRPDRGWGMAQLGGANELNDAQLTASLEGINKRLAELERRMKEGVP